MDKKTLEKLTGVFCDNYCKYPGICSNQDELDQVCDECPMNEMFELLNLK